MSATRVELSDSAWKAKLTPEQYKVLRRAGTEPAFCSNYYAATKHGAGTYHCAGCGTALFTSDAKFTSGTGWPSFFSPIAEAVASKTDVSHGMVRVEVTCAACDGHLGHVFDDGPAPTGMRYCINGVALEFRPAPSK